MAAVSTLRRVVPSGTEIRRLTVSADTCSLPSTTMFVAAKIGELATTTPATPSTTTAAMAMARARAEAICPISRPMVAKTPPTAPSTRATGPAPRSERAVRGWAATDVTEVAEKGRGEVFLWTATAFCLVGFCFVGFCLAGFCVAGACARGFF